MTAPVFGDDLGVDTLTPDCGLRGDWDTGPDDRPPPPPALLVDAGPVAAHVYRLIDSGWQQQQIAAAASCSPSTIRDLLGRTSQAPLARISRPFAAAIVALDPRERPVTPTGWQADAACKDMPDDWQPGAPDQARRRAWVAQFFPGQGESTRPARLICATCPVRVACAAHAHRSEHAGVWGGESERQRRRTSRT